MTESCEIVVTVVSSLPIERRCAQGSVIDVGPLNDADGFDHEQVVGDGSAIGLLIGGEPWEIVISHGDSLRLPLLFGSVARS
jgi:hypothetical protein